MINQAILLAKLIHQKDPDLAKETNKIEAGVEK